MFLFSSISFFVQNTPTCSHKRSWLYPLIESISNLLYYFSSFSCNKNHVKAWLLTIWSTGIWKIWKARNKINFSSKILVRGGGNCRCYWTHDLDVISGYGQNNGTLFKWYPIKELPYMIRLCSTTSV